MFTDACKKDQVWQQFTEIDVGGTTQTVQLPPVPHV